MGYGYSRWTLKLSGLPTKHEDRERNLRAPTHEMEYLYPARPFAHLRTRCVSKVTVAEIPLDPHIGNLQPSSKVYQAPSQDLIPARLGVSIVGLAGYLDLGVGSSARRGREIHGRPTVRSRTEGPAADSASILGVVPHLVILVLPEFGHTPYFQLYLHVLSDDFPTNLATGLGSQGGSCERHTLRRVVDERPEESETHYRRNQQRGGHRNPDRPPEPGEGGTLLLHPRERLELELWWWSTSCYLPEAVMDSPD